MQSTFYMKLIGTMVNILIVLSQIVSLSFHLDLDLDLEPKCMYTGK